MFSQNANAKKQSVKYFSFLNTKFGRFFGLFFWDLLLYLIFYRSILFQSENEKRIIRRNQEKASHFKMERKIDENWEEYQNCIQDIRDISQPKQLMFKLSLSTFISFAIFRNFFITFFMIIILN